ncbi:hypothetical protein UG55_105745 [Frankia sp. EI5c]|uniref:hypothetical protein n=1 Tax=Frankia sp. EI5c TaxID=683316 RepID=UPI0007C3B058|nr:hypothetical protein [Frankia sp. EI5c]OAA21626.1 hypothetical protein UG55_105745 [Frankia sp. EI5c]
MARYYVVRRSLLGTMIRWFFGFAVLAVCASTVQWAVTSMAPAMLGVFAVAALGLVVFWVIGRGRSN